MWVKFLGLEEFNGQLRGVPYRWFLLGSRKKESVCGVVQWSLFGGCCGNKEELEFLRPREKFLMLWERAYFLASLWASMTLDFRGFLLCLIQHNWLGVFFPGIRIQNIHTGGRVWGFCMEDWIPPWWFFHIGGFWYSSGTDIQSFLAPGRFSGYQFFAFQFVGRLSASPFILSIKYPDLKMVVGIKLSQIQEIRLENIARSFSSFYGESLSSIVT